MQAVARAFLRVPVLNWFLKDAIQGLPDARFYFLLSVLVAFGCLIYLFGYPLLIVSALLATAVMLVSLMVLTASDMLSGPKSR